MKKVMPPTYFLILLIAGIFLHYVFTLNQIVPNPYNYLGIILIVWGVIINIWSDRMFKRAKTTVKPFEEPTSLITSGPYSFSRHPMYLGMISILLGSAVVLGSLVTFIPPLIFLFIMEFIFIPKEEEMLEKAFGKNYVDYKENVGRWV